MIKRQIIEACYLHNTLKDNHMPVPQLWTFALAVLSVWNVAIILKQLPLSLHSGLRSNVISLERLAYTPCLNIHTSSLLSASLGLLSFSLQHLNYHLTQVCFNLSSPTKVQTLEMNFLLVAQKSPGDSSGKCDSSISWMSELKSQKNQWSSIFFKQQLTFLKFRKWIFSDWKK